VKIGDLVRAKNDGFFTVWGDTSGGDLTGLIIDYRGEEVVVYWGNKHGIDIEYREHLEVTSEKG